jgi:hypothetical protein
MDRSSYRYRPRPDHNAELRRELIALARQKRKRPVTTVFLRQPKAVILEEWEVRGTRKF